MNTQHCLPKSFFNSSCSWDPKHFFSPSFRSISAKVCKSWVRSGGHQHGLLWALPCTSAKPALLPIPQSKHGTVPATIFCLAWMCSRQTHVLFLSAHPGFVWVTNAFSGWWRFRDMLAKWLRAKQAVPLMPHCRWHHLSHLSKREFGWWPHL